MSLIPTIYSSDDPGAPQLSGTAGSLINVLRAVLVNGYGTAPNNKPGLGWTEEFTGTNKAVFRGDPVEGSGYRLRVDDTAAQSAALIAYASMTTVDAGLEPVPTAAQFANGCIWPKSTVASSASRNWWAIGNAVCFYLFIDVGGSGQSRAAPVFAGDLKSWKPGDMHAFSISHGNLASWAGGNITTRFLFSGALLAQPPVASSTGLVIARGPSGSVGAAFAAFGVGTLGTFSASNSLGGGGGLPFPLPTSGGMLFDRCLIVDGPNSVRGSLPGLYAPLHNQPYEDLASVGDIDGFPLGTRFVAKRFRSNAQITTAGDGQVLFDTAGAW